MILQIPINILSNSSFINLDKTCVYIRVMKFWFFIRTLRATCKIFDQLVLIFLIFNRLTCLFYMTLSSDCVHVNFDSTDYRNVTKKKKNHIHVIIFLKWRRDTNLMRPFSKYQIPGGFLLGKWIIYRCRLQQPGHLSCRGGFHPN